MSNRLFLTTKSFICLLFLKGLAPLSASPNVAALKLKRIGIRCYWIMLLLLFYLLCLVCCRIYASFLLVTVNYQVKTIFLPTEKPLTPEACAPLIAILPLEVRILALPLCLSVSCEFAQELVSCSAFKELI